MTAAHTSVTRNAAVDAQLYAEDVADGTVLPPLIVHPTSVQLFRFSATTGNTHRIHYDTGYARSEGYPDVLVQSHLHGAFLARTVLRWAGLAGRLREFRWDNRGTASPGDTLTCTGRVTGRHHDASTLLLEIDLEEHNQHGQLLTPGWALLELPSRHRAHPRAPV